MEAARILWGELSLFQKIAAGGVIATGSVAVFVIAKLKAGKRIEYPRDTVILHGIGRSFYVPSLTPFAIKLETYFRMANIPYQNAHDIKPSKKGKYPWIEYNGTAVADSEFCVEFLNKTFTINLNSHLSPEEDGAGRAFQKMMEENTYWTFVLDRWVLDETSQGLKMLAPWYLIGLVKRRILKSTWAQGIGRHSKQEVLQIMRIDLEALSKFLGTKDFLLGSQPCQYDCAVFGILAEIRWSSFGGQGGNIIQEFSNVCDYCERMKNKFWPDWDQCITHGGTREATR